eukprot:4714056-Prorocentrum_lima.AAC.1
MTSSLVGSEMCIRDRGMTAKVAIVDGTVQEFVAERHPTQVTQRCSLSPCLLYTSDAADDM